VIALWPAKLPIEANNRGRSWHQSALDAAEEAKRCWIKLQANKALGAYEYFKARGDFGEPVWLDKTFTELVHLAFKDRLIDTLEHRVVRELNGEA
jgi:hypothetical protein